MTLLEGLKDTLCLAIINIADHWPPHVLYFTKFWSNIKRCIISKINSCCLFTI